MVSLHVVLLALAALCFFLGAIGIPTPPRVNLTPLGLLLWVLSLLVA